MALIPQKPQSFDAILSFSVLGRCTEGAGRGWEGLGGARLRTRQGQIQDIRRSLYAPINSKRSAHDQEMEANIAAKSINIQIQKASVNH